LSRCAAGTSVGAAAGTTARPPPPSPLRWLLLWQSSVTVLVVDPVAAQEEVRRGKDRDYGQQHPGKRRGVPHPEVRESFLVEVQRVEESRIQRTPCAAADDEGRVERLKSSDQLQYEVEEDDGREQRD